MGGLVAQAVRHSPPTTGVPSLHLGHSMWVSWWTKRGLGRFFSGFLPFSPTTNFIPQFLHAHLIHSVSFHQPLWWCVRRGRPAPLLFTDLQYRGFIASHPSTRPCVILHSCPTHGQVEGCDAMNSLIGPWVARVPTDHTWSTSQGLMNWNEMDEMSVEKWCNEISGRGKWEKPLEKPTQISFRPPRNPHGVTEMRTRDPSGGRRVPNRLCHKAAFKFNLY